MAKLQEKQLGQARPGDTNAVSIYSPPDSTTTIITHIFVCETAGNTAGFRIFVDDDGTTYDETTALYFDQPTVANTTARIPCYIAMNNTDGNFAVRTATASELTFTIFGVEIS